MFIVVCIVVFIYSCPTTSTSVEPGVVAKLTKSGIDLVSDVANNWAEDWLMNYKLPTFGDDGLTLKNLRLKHISFGNPRISSTNDRVATISVRNAEVTINGDFNYSWSWLWIKKNFRGSFTIAISGVSGGLSVVLGSDNGRPTVSILKDSCDVAIDGLSAKIKGSLSWVVNLILSMLKGSIKRWLAKQICSPLVNTVNAQAERFVGKFPTSYQVPYLNVSFDASLVEPPKFDGASTLCLSLLGMFKPNQNTSSSYNFSPASMNIQGKSQMLHLGISDYSVNTLFWSLWNVGWLHGSIETNTIPFKLPFSLTSDGLKGFVPGLSGYPNRSLLISFQTPYAPTIKSTPGLLNFNITSRLTFNLGTTEEGEEETQAFVLDLNVAISGNVSVSNNNITGHVLSVNPVFKQVHSNVGSIPVSLITFLSKALLTKLLPSINDFFIVGMPIPSYQGFSSKNQEITILQNYMEIGTDLDYNADYQSK